MAEDPELEVVRRAIPPGTTRSIKQTFCAWVLIRAVRRKAGAPGSGPSPPGRRRGIVLASTGAVIAIIHWWHEIAILLGHIRP
jgi:hypothetical protein